MSGLLWSLVYATFLPIVWSIIGGVQRARAEGGFDNNNPPRQAATLSGMGERANAAHQNAWEALMMSTPVMIATLTGADAAAKTTTGIVFCVARTLHGILYCMDLASLRSLSWFVGLGATIYLIVLAT